MLIGLDAFGQIKDFYYHYPGLENHVGEYLIHKIGVFVDDRFSWIDNGEWNVVVHAQKGTMASDICAKNESFGIELDFTDIVYNEKNMFIREISVKNLFDRKRSIKLFFNQQFNISETHIGDTAYFDPREEVIIHYKGRRVFLINTLAEEAGFDEYSIGLIGIEGQIGTYRDAEDGKLSGNPIEHGQVDSVISINIELPTKGINTVYYWICVAKSIEAAKRLNEEILGRHPKEIIESTVDYWKAWVNVQNFSFYGLGPEVIELFQKSLFYIRAHVAQNGAIIASGDSEMLQFGRDYYRYVWPRDSSVAAVALEKAGDLNATRRFFKFCNDTITEEGFFMHKYRPDKSIGSSWHPWVSDGRKQYPIQEDETALVLYALWKYYEISKDLEFVESIYNSLIKEAAEFMVNYRDEKTGLPKASYDIWEQYYGISTFTSSAVFGALVAATKFALLLGKEKSAEKYKEAAETIKKAILKYLYDDKESFFYKMIHTGEKQIVIDRTMDVSAIYGIYKFGVLDIIDPKVKKAIEKTIDRLEVKTEIGGIARYEGDTYHHKGGNYPGNPWIITTMWIAQYYISIAKSESDLEPVKRYLSWAVKYANPAGILPEQLDPYSGEHLSASPLVESHGEFVTTVISYLEKLEELGVCKACYPIT
ncbi:MAG: glucoamylase [Microgenomates group bacterium GW2011_GWC1_37_8]|nr:MAG: glucoamylase [Microgenomates group bacterium GW2011_GWC1_37_8]